MTAGIHYAHYSALFLSDHYFPAAACPSLNILNGCH